jgi:sulfopyruvate decarboxylase subunit alpha
MQLTNSQRIAGGLKEAGVNLVASLPDSWLKGVIKAVESDPYFQHVRVTREDDGVGICAGAYLGGRKAALICQNAGLLLSTNALAAYGLYHQIPFVCIAAYRGTHEDRYYYQMYKGRVIEPVLSALGLPYHLLDTPEDLSIIGDAVTQAYLNRMPVVLLMTRRALEGLV